MSLGCARISASDLPEQYRWPAGRDRGRSPTAEAQDLGSCQCGFESHRPHHRPHQIGHCTNTRPWSGRNGVSVYARTCLRLRDAEDEHDPARAGDLDLGDERFDKSFALAVTARGDDLADVIGDLAEGGCRWRCWQCGKLGGEFVVAGG
jgi:hypothetical protein